MRNKTSLNCGLAILQAVLIGVCISSAAANDVKSDPFAEKKDPCKECYAAPKDPTVWDKTLAFGLNLTRGNSDTLLSTVVGKAARDYEGEIWNFELGGSYGNQREESNGQTETTNQAVSTKAEYKHLLNERMYLALGSTFLYDKVADINYRVLVNPALGYFFIRESEIRLGAEVGPSYVFEDVGGETDNYLAPRIAERFDWKLSATSKLYQLAEAYLDVNDSENYIVNAEVGVAASLTSMLSLVVTAKNAYDNIPADGKEKNDLSLVAGLQVNL